MLKDINPEYSLEGLMLKLKLQYFGWGAESRLGAEGRLRRRPPQGTGPPSTALQSFQGEAGLCPDPGLIRARREVRDRLSRQWLLDPGSHEGWDVGFSSNLL